MSRVVPFQGYPPGRLYTPAEVAHMFRVTTRTVARWAQLGKITEIRTPSGHRRYIEAEIEQLRREGS